MKEIDTETKLKALELYVQGKSNREIATELGISHPTAGKIIAEINSEGLHMFRMILFLT